MTITELLTAYTTARAAADEAAARFAALPRPDFTSEVLARRARIQGGEATPATPPTDETEWQAAAAARDTTKAAADEAAKALAALSDEQLTAATGEELAAIESAAPAPSGPYNVDLLTHLKRAAGDERYARNRRAIRADVLSRLSTATRAELVDVTAPETTEELRRRALKYVSVYELATLNAATAHHCNGAHYDYALRLSAAHVLIVAEGV